MGEGPAVLERMLRNEADTSTKHRIRVALEYLDLQPGDRLLDAGCGLGWPLKVLTETRGARAVGADIDLGRLARARREVRGDVPLLAADVTRLPFPDDTFDKVLLSEVLEHVPDDLAGVHEVRRVLRPDGVVAVTVPNHDYPFLWDPINWTRERLGLAPIRGGVLGGIWTDHVRLYRRDEIVGLLERAGLLVEDVRGLVHHCLPFAHNLVYGIGKPLVERGILPGADRFRYADDGGAPWRPLRLGRRLLDAIDRLDRGTPREGRTTVVIGVKARKRR